jgi:hypothetical protein
MVPSATLPDTALGTLFERHAAQSGAAELGLIHG